MGTLFMASAKTQDTTLWSSTTATNGTLTVDTAQFRTPDYGVLTGRSYKALVNGTSGVAYGNVSLSAGETSFYTRCAFYLDTTTGTEIILARFYEGAQLHILVGFTPSTGTIRVFRTNTSTVLATSANNVFLPQAWFTFEIWLSIADAGGRAVVRINGSTSAVIDFTGDTRNVGTAGAIDLIQLGLVVSAPNPTTLYMDDAMVRDDTWCGAGALYLLATTANGATMNWTPSSGAAGDAWDLLNEIPPSFTDYISTDATVANTRAEFEVQNLPVTPITITSVGVLSKMRVSAAGGGSATVGVNSNATVSESATVSLDVSEQWVRGYFDVNPDGAAAWNEAAVNAVKVLVETA